MKWRPYEFSPLRTAEDNSKAVQRLFSVSLNSKYPDSKSDGISGAYY